LHRVVNSSNNCNNSSNTNNSETDSSHRSGGDVSSCRALASSDSLRTIQRNQDTARVASCRIR
jgi:hypothetical protein